MTRLKSFLKTALVLAIPAAFAFASPKSAEAQVVVGAVVQGPEVVVEPPSAFIATAAPEYYGGRPCYWYHDHWYYRDGFGRWGYYRAEPGFLRGRRDLWARPGYYGRGYVRVGPERREYHPAPGRYVYRR